MTCGKCVEGFDHHCVVANNCIGYKNHALFLSWLAIFWLYSIITMYNLVVAMIIYAERIAYCVGWRRQTDRCHPLPYTEDIIFSGLAFVFFVFEVVLSLPLVWQILQQCRSLRKQDPNKGDQDFKDIFENPLALKQDEVEGQ